MSRGLGPNYRKLWTASAVSNVGDGITSAAFPLLAASLTRDPTTIAGIAAAARLPWLVFSLVGGALVDRSDRRVLMGAVDLFRGGLMVLLGLAVVGGWATIPFLYALAIAFGFAEVLFDNASQSVMPAVVAHESLERANARIYAAEIVANSFAGPPLGGLLFAAAASVPFLVDGGSFFAAALLVLAMRGATFRAERPEGPRRTLRAEIAEGLRWLWGHPLLRPMALILGMLNLAGNAALSLAVLFALEILGLDEIGFGLLLTAGAAGSLAGTALASRLSRRFGPGRTILATVVVMTATMAAAGATSDPYLFGVMSALFAAAGIVWNVITVSLRQSIIPPALLGRVNSVYRFLAWGTIPVGAMLGGLLADASGLRAPFFAAAAIQAVLVVAVAVWTNDRAISEAKAAAQRPST